VEATDTLLFDLKADPGEHNSVLSTRRSKVKEILSAWTAFEKKLGATPEALVQRMPADNSHFLKRAKRRPELNR